MLTLSENALHATVVRDRKYRFVGARCGNLDDVMKAVAMDFDFVIVKPEVFEATLWKGEPRLPTYVEDVPASDLRLWQASSARMVDLPAILNAYTLQRGLPSPRGGFTAPSPRRPMRQ